MTRLVPAFALFGDFAATLLAVSLLVFIVVLAPNGAGSIRAASTPVVAETMRGFHRQAPLGGADAVDFLYALRPPLTGTLIELHGDRVIVETPKGRQEHACRDGSIPPLPSSGPIRVAVFSATCGTAVLRAIAVDPSRARVLSVPAALRSGVGDDWSPAFKALLTADLDRPAFADRLARIISRAVDRGGTRVDGGAPDNERAATPAITERLRSSVEVIGAAVLLLAALAVILVAERRRLLQRLSGLRPISTRPVDRAPARLIE